MPLDCTKPSSSEECDFEVAPSPQTHENGPTWAFPGRPAASAHQALAGFCGGSGRARQTSRGHAGWRARRTAGNHRRPSGPGTVTGSVFHGVVTSLGWDFGGMKFLQPHLGSLMFAAIQSFRENRRSIGQRGPMVGCRAPDVLQTADRSIRTRCGATRSGADRAAVWICW